MSVNKAILVGRLGRDPETRYTSGGQAVANFTLATDETFKDRAGERQKRTEWHRIVLWGKLAEIAQQYLKKGMLVYVEGRIQTRQWEDKRDGQKRTTTEIVGNVMRMLTSRAEGAAAGAGASAGGGMSHGRSADADFDVAGPGTGRVRAGRPRNFRRRYSLLVFAVRPVGGISSGLFLRSVAAGWGRGRGARDGIKLIVIQHRQRGQDFRGDRAILN